MKNKLSNLMFLRLKLFLILITLFSLNREIFSNNGIGNLAACKLNTPIRNNDTVNCEDQVQDTLQRIARFDRTEDGSDYYYVRLSLFHSEFERLDFYEKARDHGIYIADKNNFYSDSALFVTTFDKAQARLEFRELYQSSEDADLSTSETDKKILSGHLHFIKRRLCTNLTG